MSFDGSETLWILGSHLRWSPEGDRIAFVERARVLKVGLFDSSDVLSTVDASWTTPFNRNQYMWSPDGQKLIIREQGRICVKAADGSTIRSPGEIFKAPESFATGEQLAWSPDGSLILHEAKGTIHVIDPDGGNAVQVGEGSDAFWCPDGSRVFFAEIERFGREVLGRYICVVNADGTGKERLTEGHSPLPSW